MLLLVFLYVCGSFVVISICIFVKFVCCFLFDLVLLVDGFRKTIISVCFIIVDVNLLNTVIYAVLILLVYLDYMVVYYHFCKVTYVNSCVLLNDIIFMWVLSLVIYIFVVYIGYDMNVKELGGDSSKIFF